MALTRLLPTQNPAGLPVADHRRIHAGMLARNADGSARPGILPAHAGGLVSGRTDMAYDVAPFVAALARSHTGAEFVANDALTRVATDPAPNANSRIDVIWVRSLFPLFGDATTDPVFGVTKGVASAPSPAKPTIPAGALELGTATIPSTATTTQASGVVITPTHAFTAMAGGCVLLRNQAEQDAWTPQPGQEAYRLDTKQRLIYVPDATTPGWFHVGGKPTLTAPTLTGIYSSGVPAPRVIEAGGRISLDGVVLSTTANFAAGVYYQVGTIPADKAPVSGIQYAATLNGVFGGISISAAGAVSFFSSVAFTGGLNLYLGGASWPDKKL
ncbi:MAG: hypothetical protein AAGC61_01785 [Microbacterium sp.]